MTENDKLYTGPARYGLDLVLEFFCPLDAFMVPYKTRGGSLKMSAGVPKSEQ